MNWVVKKRPAWVSVKFQRAMKTGRMGPRIVQTMPVRMKPAKSVALMNFVECGVLAMRSDMMWAHSE